MAAKNHLRNGMDSHDTICVIIQVQTNYKINQDHTIYCRHYRKLALCRVPEALPSVFYRALGKDGLCRVPFFWHSAKMYFAECLCFGTRQRGILPCAFFFALGKSVFQSNF